MERVWSKLLAIAVLLVSAGCSLTPPIAESPTITPSPTSGSFPQACYWNWSTRPLPDLSAQIQSALETSGFRDASGIAEAYGEECIDPKSGEVVSFAAMETDFRIHLQLKDTSDHDELGRQLERVLLILDEFSRLDTPGTAPGYIGVTFDSPDDHAALWFLVTDADQARSEGLTGAALYERLQER